MTAPLIRATAAEQAAALAAGEVSSRELTRAHLERIVMFRRGISRMPVVDENGKLVGIITNTDMVRSHIERSKIGRAHV